MVTIKKRGFWISLLAIAVCFISVSAQAQTLWGSTSYGMSPAEVLKVVQGVHSVKNGSTLGTEQKAKELLRVDDYQVVNESFKIRFYFTKEKLVQVTLNLNKERNFDQTLFVFERLSDVLRAKYGKEISRKVDYSVFLNNAYANWVSDRTNINLLVTTVGDNPATLNLNYQIRLMKDADKL